MAPPPRRPPAAVAAPDAAASPADGADAHPDTSGGFEIQIDDDLLSEALAAVDARARGQQRPPDPDEMSAFAADLEIDAVRESDEDDHDDEDIFLVDSGDEGADEPDDPDAEASDEGSSEDGGEVVAALARELGRMQGRVNAAEAARAEAAGQLEAAHAELTDVKQRARKLKAVWQKDAEELQRVNAHLGRARDEVARQHGLAKDADERAKAAEAALATTREALGRAEADLERAHDRRRRELADAQRAAHEQTWRELLPVLDNLQMAADHSPDDGGPLAAGVRMVLGQFHNALARLGVERVPAAAGQAFDPAHHEAVATEPHPDAPPGAVLREVQAGFRHAGRLLRAARVVVAAAPPAPRTVPGDL